MTATNASPVYLNGHAPAYRNDLRNEDSYEKIIKLYKDVVSGTHPRLKVSNTAAVNESSSASLQNGTANSTLQASLGTQPNTSNSFQFPPGLNNFAASTTSSTSQSASQHPWANPAPAPPQHRQTTVASTPQFNPILLQKSDELIKAEMELKKQRQQQAEQAKLQKDRLQELKNSRHRIEGVLHQELNARKGNVDIDDGKQCNVGEAFIQAQLLVPPISGVKSPTPVDASSESFDENSYYSSKANTWSTERSDPQHDQTIPDIDVMSLSDADDDLYEEYEPPAQIAIESDHALDTTVMPQPNNAIPGLGEHAEQHDLDEPWEPEWDEEEEEEDDDYEPPAPHAFPEQVQGSTLAYNSQTLTHQLNQYYAPTPVQTIPQGGQAQHGSSENRIRSPISVALNHIPIPIAPQPSRISPLAVGNLATTFRDQNNTQRYVPSVQPNGRRDNPNTPNGTGRATGYDSRRPSPTGPNATKGKGKKAQRAAALAGEKKRKRGGSPDNQTPKKNRKEKRRPQPQVQQSPEPYIKPEPVSPQPGFSRSEYSHSRRGTYREADDTLMASPRITRPQSAYYEYDHSPRGYRSGEDDRAAMPPPAPYRRPERDTQDLRRVASLQNYARRPPSPAREYVPYADPRVVEQPAQYAVIERPYTREPAYRESSVRPDAPRYVRAPRSPSPPRAADPYARIHSPALMPPPPVRQVVVDQYGTRFYVEPAPPVDYRYAAPRQLDPRYERASTRAPVGPLRIADPYEEDPYRGMPPPPRARAFSHMPEAEIVDQHRDRAFSVRPQAVPARSVRGGFDQDDFTRPPPPRFEEVPREYAPAPRAFSVHPEPPRREAVPEYASRPGSVHPEAYARRMPPPPPREQIDDGYRYAPPVPRYVEDVEPVDEVGYGGDGRRIVSYRY